MSGASPKVLRSQRTKSDDTYLEISLFDLKQKYGGTEEGRLGEF